MPDDTRSDTSPLHAVPDTPTPAAGRWSPNALKWSAARAARETGAARSTILEALKSGRLEGTKDADGHWQITPEALWAAGFTPGKPTPPDPQPLEDRDDDAARLRLELAEVRAESRVLTVSLEAERRILEAVERERDLYRRMLEQGESSHTRPESTQAGEQAAPISSHAHDPDRPSTANVGRLRRAWNVVRFG